tara:strand:- start:147 stop:1754 length:1608 start_codon:yes stop_codon:yes gene_type:complete
MTAFEEDDPVSPSLRPYAAEAPPLPKLAEEPVKPMSRQQLWREKLNTLPEWVLREDHPINVGGARGRPRRHPKSFTGKKGKWYLRCDYVTPIVDSCRMMCGFPVWDSADAPPAPEPVAKKRRTQPSELAPPEPSAQRPRCVACGNNDPGSFEETSDRDALVCRCGTVNFRSFVAQHREKNCTEDEDKTTHADRPKEQEDPYMQPALSAEETRKQREREVKTTYMSKRLKEKLNIGWTQEHLERVAAADRRKSSDMSSKEQSKLDKVRRALEELFVKIEPVENTIKAHCRFTAEQVWRRSVEHARICSHSACQRNIRTLSATVLAEAILHCSLQGLVHGQHALQGVARSSILGANDKLAKHVPPANATQRVNRSRVDQLLKQPSCEQCVSCTPTSPESVCSERSSNVSLSRCDSDLADSELMQLRDCITRMHRVMTSSPVVVHKGAMAAISNSGFLARLTADPELSALSKSAVAFAILQATDRLRGAGAMKLDKSLQTMLGMKPTDAQKATNDVFRLLPDNLLGQIEQDEEDDLFD